MIEAQHCFHSFKFEHPLSSSEGAAISQEKKGERKRKQHQKAFMGKIQV